MRTIVHLSDLHFGRVYEPLLEPLSQVIKSIKPDVIAISGDLTMRARQAEFVKAKAFLDSLPFPQVIVPGNHDIPLYDLYSRFFTALKKYRHYISGNLAPVYKDEHMVMYGLNTARSFAVKRGRVDLVQVAKICEEFSKLPPEVLKIVVSHHPFDLPLNFAASNLIRRHVIAMDMLIKSKTDLFLAGHTHTSLIAHVPEHCKALGYSTLMVQAGTATSIRTRGEHNTFNILQFEYPLLQINSYLWDEEKKVFLPQLVKKFTHTKNGWHSVV